MAINVIVANINVVVVNIIVDDARFTQRHDCCTHAVHPAS
jgi:hypothetical protein